MRGHNKNLQQVIGAAEMPPEEKLITRSTLSVLHTEVCDTLSALCDALEEFIGSANR
jgi:hypothetical protein